MIARLSWPEAVTSRAKKTQILDELVELTGWHRDYARAALRDVSQRGPRRGGLDRGGDADDLAATAQMIGHVAQRGGHDASSLGQCRLHAVKQFGDHVRLEPAQRHPTGAITTAR